MSASSDIRNRITELIAVKPADLQDNTGNWRIHPQVQEDALRDIVEQVGITDVLKVYRSKRQGGLTLIDGHLRKTAYPDTEWPALLLDVSDEEADLLLASGDAIAALAQASADRLIELRQRTMPTGQNLTKVLDGLYERAGSALKRVEDLRTSPIMNNPTSQAAQALSREISGPVLISPSAVATAAMSSEDAIGQMLNSQTLPQRPDYSSVIEQFKPPTRGETAGNEKWFYIEYYADADTWEQLSTILKPFMKGLSKHEIDPEVFRAMVLRLHEQTIEPA